MEPTADPTPSDPAQWPVGRLLSAAARRVERSWDAHLAGWDLNHASLPVLLHLFAGPTSQRELAAATGVTEQTISRTISRLERTGLVVRSEHGDDRRRLDVEVTDAGRRAALESADPRVAEQVLHRALSPEQLDALRLLLLAVVVADGSTDPGADQRAAP